MYTNALKKKLQKQFFSVARKKFSALRRSHHIIARLKICNESTPLPIPYVHQGVSGRIFKLKTTYFEFDYLFFDIGNENMVI